MALKSCVPVPGEKQLQVKTEKEGMPLDSISTSPIPGKSPNEVQIQVSLVTNLVYLEEEERRQFASSFHSCGEQQAAADSRGSKRRVKEHPAVVPSSRRKTRAYKVGLSWYEGDGPHLAIFDQNSEQATLVKTVNIQKWTRPSVLETGDCFKVPASCCLIWNTPSGVGSLQTGSLAGSVAKRRDSNPFASGLNVQSEPMRCLEKRRSIVLCDRNILKRYFREARKRHICLAFCT
jgi:hypothetical protein